MRDATAASGLAQKPPVTGNFHALPFEALSPQKFEELCLWLVRREGYENAEYLGEAGGEQGRDVVAWRGGRRVVFQCKRVQSFTLATAKLEIDKLRGLPAEDGPAEIVFVVSRAVSADLRKDIRAYWGDESSCQFWGGKELDERVKKHREVVEEFFQVGQTSLTVPRLLSRGLNWGITLSASGLLATLAAWYWPFSPAPAKPAIYSIRVQVLDPEGRPVSGSSVRTSAGNEPQQLPDGWWEIEVPSAKVPNSGRIAVRADHPEWEGAQVELSLENDPNASVGIHLRPPSSWLRGRAVDSAGRDLEGVRITALGHAIDGTTTGTDGRFELKLPVVGSSRIRVRAEFGGQGSVDVFCYSGRDSCLIHWGHL